MKKFITLFIICIIFSSESLMKAQTVVSSGGDFFENVNYTLSWTLGEPVILTLSNEYYIMTQGFQQPVGLDYQVIPLPSVWNIFSTYIYPVNPLVPAVVSQVSPIILIKDWHGNVYWPSYGINNIGDFIMGDGYQVRMSLADTLIVSGIAAVPENTPLDLPYGWSMIGYLRKSFAPIEQMLSSINGNFMIVKDEVGQVYWPGYSVNDIVNMYPGKGYQIKMYTACTFYYPPNFEPIFKDIIFSVPVHYNLQLNTGNNMTLCIPEYAWYEKPEAGDEIGILDDDGQLAGSTIYNGFNTAIAIWGIDEYIRDSPGIPEGMQFSIWLWKKYTGDETKLEVEKWKEGNNFYITNGISVVEKLKAPFTSDYLVVIPNPANDKVELEFMINKASVVHIVLNDQEGKTIKTVCHENTSGVQVRQLDLSKIASGQYVILMSTEGTKISRNLCVVH